MLENNKKTSVGCVGVSEYDNPIGYMNVCKYTYETEHNILNSSHIHKQLKHDKMDCVHYIKKWGICCECLSVKWIWQDLKE